MKQTNVLQGAAIIVADCGFVYVGNASIDEQWCVVTNAQNIRVWGTTKGLGELVNGPIKDTKLDQVGVVRIPMRAVISVIEIDAAKWKL